MADMSQDVPYDLNLEQAAAALASAVRLLPHHPTAGAGLSASALSRSTTFAAKWALSVLLQAAS